MPLADQTQLPCSSNIPEQNEDKLSESQLRELYDNEEIDRFLRLFSSFVTEVQMPDTPTSADSRLPSPLPKGGEDHISFPHTSEESDWVPPGDVHLPSLVHPAHPGPTSYNSLSDYIAWNFIIPILPQPRPPTPTFTIGQLRLSTQRLYLATLPGYVPFLRNVKHLATWEDHQSSLVYCCLFWILWWNDLLGSALMLRILYSFFHRRIFAYPSLSDLRSHREAVGRADYFSEQMTAKISSKGSSVTEVFRLFRLVDLKMLGKKKAIKKHVKQASLTDSSKDSDHDSVASYEQDTTVLDNVVDDDDEIKDIKQDLLWLMDEVADLHERIQNLFIWRKPTTSMKYGMILFATSLFVMFLPTKYIVKLAFFTFGFIFWHMVPVIAALPPADMKRLPPPFVDVPTHAQYAMHVISQRVAAGLDIRPKPMPKRRKSDNVSDVNLAASSHDKTPEASEKSIDWEKWGNRFATGISVVNDIKRLKPASSVPVWPPNHPLIPGVVGIAQPNINVETHTFPCQHSKSPGLITLTPSSMFFTPVMSQKPKLIIPLNAVKGIKKAGLLRGLNVRWRELVDGKKETREDSFLWVGGRDELFARLVGTDGSRWVNV